MIQPPPRSPLFPYTTLFRSVRDLHQSAEFYTKVWALEQISAEGDCMHFRATGGEHHVLTIRQRPKPALLGVDRKSTRLNSSHLGISYAVFCLKKKKKDQITA